MKNLFLYYLVAFIIPLPIILWVNLHQSSNLFVGVFVIYLFIYRGFLDSYRLIQKGTITRKDIWKMFIGGGHVRWFKELYLEK